MVVAFAYLALFMLTNRFVIERYSSVITLFVLAHLAFILAALWQRASGRLLRYAVVLLLVGLAGDSLHNGDYRKAFIRDATQWLKQNTPAEASIASNEMYVAYFSRRDYDWSHYEAYDYRVSDLGKRPELWRGRDYLVMTVKPPEMEDWQQFAGSDGREEIAVFAGSSGTSVRVLRLPEDQ
jgi:hypothetical protein